MKILILSGNHPRHRYIIEPVFHHFKNIKVIMHKRESVKEGPTTICFNNIEKSLVIRHFKNRFIKETKKFGNKIIKDLVNKENFFEIDKDLSVNFIKKKLKKFKPDMVFSIGFSLINKQVIAFLPKNTINIHLGLSPWYRGSATLMWPTYNLEPWKTGVTFHRISDHIDDGPILHQSVPEMKKNYDVIDLSIAAISKAKIDLNRILKKIKKKEKLKFVKQKFNGKTYFTNSFRGSHLLVIYKFFNNKVCKYFFKTKKQLPKFKIINFLR